MAQEVTMKAQTLSVLAAISLLLKPTTAFAQHESWIGEAALIIGLARCVDVPCVRQFNFGGVMRRWQSTEPVCREMTARGFRQCSFTRLRQWKERRAVESAFDQGRLAGRPRISQRIGPKH